MVELAHDWVVVLGSELVLVLVPDSDLDWKVMPDTDWEAVLG